MNGISTGTYVAPAVAEPASSGSAEFALTLFDTRSSSKLSRLVVIPEGMTLLVFAYELAGGQMTVKRVALSRPPMPQGQQCGGYVSLSDGASVAFEKAVQTKVAGLWRMSDTDNLRSLAVPGTYRFELSDQSLVGQTYVEGTLLPQRVGSAALEFGAN